MKNKRKRRRIILEYKPESVVVLRKGRLIEEQSHFVYRQSNNEIWAFIFSQRSHHSKEFKYSFNYIKDEAINRVYQYYDDFNREYYLTKQDAVSRLESWLNDKIKELETKYLRS